MFRKLALAAVAVTGVLATGSVASAHEDQSSVTAEFNGTIQGVNNLGDPSGAGLAYLSVEGGDVVRTICIEFGVEFLGGVSYHADGSDALKAISADSLAAVRWLASHMTYNADGSLGSSPVGTPIAVGADGIMTEELLPYAEAVAAQLGFWKFSQGVDISGVIYPSIVTRADEIAALLADPANRVATEGAHDFSIVAGSQVATDGVGSIEAVVFGQYTAENLPVAGVPVTISAPGVDLDPATPEVEESVVVESGDSGKVTLSGITGLTAETAVTASASFALLPGTVLTHESGQQVATLNVASVTREVVAYPEVAIEEQVDAPETTVPETTVPETTAPETTVQTPVDEGLPRTGNEVTFVLLGLGLAAGVIGYRMRTS